MPGIDTDIKNALEVLKKGGTILYPTDTIWGIGCDATNEKAVDQVYRIKQRIDSKTMLVLLDHIDRLPSYVSQIPEITWDLVEASMDPLTIIYPAAKNLAKNLINSDGTVGIRIPNNEFCQKLISRFIKPIVSTSANISGDEAPANYQEISEVIINAVDYVVDWGQDDYTKKKASSIIKLGINGEFEILRK